MRRFAELLERLAFTPSRNAKLRLLTDYLRATPDPDRGWALAALTGDLDIAAVKPALLRDARHRPASTPSSSRSPTTSSATSPRPSR